MANLEEEMLYHAQLKPLVWHRYIDDVFFIWPHRKENLDDFLDFINNYHETIKFTAEVSEEEVTFLDTRVKLTPNGELYTDLFVKPTDKSNYLHFKSALRYIAKKQYHLGN